jgi:hypothetical protein
VQTKEHPSFSSEPDEYGHAGRDAIGARRKDARMLIRGWVNVRGY